MKLVDTHCHLQLDAFDNDRESALARALDELQWLVVVGDDVASSQAAVELAATQANSGRVYATAGLHPHHAQKVTENDLTAIQGLMKQPHVVALGEIGLDYYYDFSPRDVQQAVFQAQLKIAEQEQAPVVIHCRDANDDLAALLEPVVGRLAGGVMHCFGGDAAFADRCLSWGFYISFAGNVTFPKARPLQEAAKVVPLDRLLVETDAPYLAPQPVRGKRCEPSHVLYTARYLAQLKGVDIEELAAATTANAQRAFPRAR